jgi:hypothetical protein
MKEAFEPQKKDEQPERVVPLDKHRSTPRKETQEELHGALQHQPREQKNAADELLDSLRARLIRVISDVFPEAENVPDRELMYRRVSGISNTNIRTSTVDALQWVAQYGEDMQKTAVHKQFVRDIDALAQSLNDRTDATPEESYRIISEALDRIESLETVRTEKARRIVE